MKRIHIIFCFLILIGILPSCRKSRHEDTPAPKPSDVTESKESVRGLQTETETEVISMPEDVVYVKDDINTSLKSYDPENGTITFENGTAMKNADIKVGDVLYSMPVEGVAPDGYIVRVTGIRYEGNKVIYEVEEAGLADAFDYIDTEIPLAFEKMDESCITVYDPFSQADQTERIDALYSQNGVDTKGAAWEIEPTLKWEQDRWELKTEKEKTTLEIVLQDIDGDYKTKYDQIRLRIKLTYDFFDEGVVGYSFDAKRLVYSVDMKPKLGVSAGVLFFKDKVKIEPDKIPSQKEKKELMDEMESKLLGKKICIGHFDVPVGPASILIKPRFEVYLFFKVNLSGELEVEAGLEDIPVRAHLENFSMSSVINPVKSYVKVEHKPKGFFRIDANVDVKGALGVGTGFAVGLPKLVSKDDIAPYAGLFYDASINGKAKIKSVVDITDMELKTTISAEAYAETVGYAEAYAHLKGDIIFNGKLEINKTRYPEEDSGAWKWDTTFVKSVPVPFPLLLSPSFREVTDDNVTLKWIVNCQEYYGPYKYDVFVSEDKTEVEQSNVRARVAQGISDETFSLTVGKMKTYYWRVRCTDAAGRDYDSDVFTFDSGSDGVIPLTDALKRYFAVNFNALDDVHFQEDGTLLRSPSNICALEKVTSFLISDPEGKYSITNIDGILMHLPSLEMLDCSFNSIQSLYLVENPRLRALTCHDNALKELNLQYTSALTSISCSNNVALTSLDISPCPKLEILKCDKCGLESLSLSKNPGLIELFASENDMDYLDITWAKNLIRLDLHAQHKERMTLRLTQLQRQNFALFQPHVNTDYEYGDPVVIETGEAFNITATSAEIPVRVHTTLYLPERGVIYSAGFTDPQLGRDLKAVCENAEDDYVVKLEGLEPATVYYARGYIRDPSNFKTAYGDVVSFTTGSSSLLAIEPEEYEFGEVKVGESAVCPVRLTNNGEEVLHLSIEYPEGPFTCSLSGASVKKNETVFAYITFAPKAEGESKCIFTVHSDDPHGDRTFTVWGTGVAGGGTSGGDPTFSVPEAVDLGLSVLWGSFNVGASSPLEYGDYYAWGETTTKENYSWENYKWCKGTYDSLTKYNTDSSYGTVDNKTVLDVEDDVAHVKLGGKWRIPRDVEWEELRDKCTWTWTWAYQGSDCIASYSGWVVTSKVEGYTDKSIFIRPAGWMDNSTNEYAGNAGQYSSSTYGSSLFVDKMRVYTKPFSRQIGLSVRPVYGDWEGIPLDSVSLNKDYLALTIGEVSTLTATVYPYYSTADKSLSWESSNPEVARVFSSGLVAAVSEGRATITVSAADGSITARCTISVTSSTYTASVPEAVDMGLSVKWASHNVGASLPEEYGYYFSWGELVRKKNYCWESYKWCNGSYNSLTKYNTDSDYGTVDNKTELEADDDVAHVKIRGNWRIPTDAEWTELSENCTWTWTTQNGVNGRLVTSNKNGNSIFLPAAGYMEKYPTYVGTFGSYWSSTLHTKRPDRASYMSISSSAVYVSQAIRSVGYSIRPVLD